MAWWAKLGQAWLLAAGTVEYGFIMNRNDSYMDHMHSPPLFRELQKGSLLG